jgi:hypothetical protein
MLIEQTALQLAANLYEIGRSQGMTSKYKTARDYAKANVEKFIPLAVNHLIEALSGNVLGPDQKDLIYQAIMERTNDAELSNIGIESFKNDTPYLPEKAVIYDKRTIDQAVMDTNNLQLKREGKIH